MKSKKFTHNNNLIIILLLSIVALALLFWSPWLKNEYVYNKVFKEKAVKDKMIDTKTGELWCDYHIIWVPFGRLISSCESNHFMIFWGKVL